MGEGEREYNVLVCAYISDELLIEAKSSEEAEDIAKEMFLESMTGEQAITLVRQSLEACEVEEAV